MEVFYHKSPSAWIGCKKPTVSRRVHFLLDEPGLVSEIALNIVPPCALWPKLSWQASIAARRLPVPRGVPVLGDFTAVANYPRNSSRQNRYGDDNALPMATPSLPEPTYYARRNNKRVGNKAPEKQVYRLPSWLAVGNYRISRRALIRPVRRQWKPEVPRIPTGTIIQRIGVYLYPHCCEP